MQRYDINPPTAPSPGIGRETMKWAGFNRPPFDPRLRVPYASVVCGLPPPRHYLAATLLPFYGMRQAGFEPALPAWRAGCLSLSY